MKIGIDCRFVVRYPTGIGRYTLGLVERLLARHDENEYVLIHGPTTYRELLSTIAKGRARLEWCPYEPVGLKQKLFCHRYINRLDLDIYHYPHHDLPLFIRSARVVTIHHLVQGNRGTATGRLKNMMLRASTGWGWRVSDAAICVSQSTLRAMEDTFGSKPLSTVAYPLLPVARYESGGQPRPGEIVEKLERQRYFLFVGQVRPNKNLERLLLAFVEFCRVNSDWDLVIVGPGYRDYDPFKEVEIPRSVRERIFRLGAVSEQSLETLYQNAGALVLVSTLEGFGYPLVEAMRHGIPIVCSDVTSLPEVCGDAALRVDPYRTAHIANALVGLAGDMSFRERLAKLSKARFEWYLHQDTTQKVLSLYERAVQARSSNG